MAHDKQADSKRGVFYGFQQDQGNGSGICRKGKNVALDLAEKGKTQALIVNEQGKLLKAQRQLGCWITVWPRARKKTSRWWMVYRDDR